MKRILCVVMVLLWIAVPVLAESISGVIRGGTIIARFPGDWVRSRNLQEVFSFGGTTLNDDGQIRSFLKDSLSDADYESFVSDFELKSRAELTIDTITLSPDRDDFVLMNIRKIDDDWYAVLRPNSKAGSSFTVACDVDRLQMSRDGFSGTFLTTPVASERIDSLKIKLQNKKAKQVHSFKDGGITIDILKTRWGAAAVLYTGTDAALQTRLHIADDPVGIAITGYTENGKNVYCAMLTDHEYELLRDECSVKFSSAFTNRQQPSGPFYIG